MSMQATGSFWNDVHTISCPILCLPWPWSQPLTCSSRTARRLQQCHHRSSPALHPGQRQPCWAAPACQHSHPSSPQKHAKAWGPDPAVLNRVALMGASPIMCLAPWPSLPRAAYVLTGRNTGKQLAASDPVVSQQESTQMPIPPFHGQHPHLQMCLAGVKFKACSYTF